MSFPDLRSFIQSLEHDGELVRIKAEVDPDQDITIIQHRVLAANGPALLFENVKGSPYRVVSNLFGTEARVRRVFGRPPAEIGGEVAGLAHRLMPPSVGAVWKARKTLWNLTGARLRNVRTGPVLEQILEPPQLDELPVLTCWPLDGAAASPLRYLVRADLVDQPTDHQR